jgi:predicted transglutaminase-like cysteine proteinase
MMPYRLSKGNDPQQDWFAPMLSPKAWNTVNAARQKSGLSRLAEEPVLQRAAEDSAAAVVEAVRENPRDPQLNASGDAGDLQEQLPGLAHLSSQVLATGDLDGMLRELADSQYIVENALTHAGVALVEARLETGQPFFAAAIFVGEILLSISPELINQGRRKFRVPCHQCGGSCLMQLRKLAGEKIGCLNAICPDCERPVDVFGADTSHQYHRPPWFMRRFCPKALRDPLEVWLEVLTHVQYVEDAEHFGRDDVWQLAEETYRCGRGDCEDSSILLADWLETMGQKARVVLGEHEGKGHAWVVLDKGGHHYILESTGGAGRHRSSPPRSTEMREYVPEIQFDRTGVWFRTSNAWTWDYSSQQEWKRGPWPLEPRRIASPRFGWIRRAFRAAFGRG